MIPTTDLPDPQSLRTATEELCRNLRQDIARLEGGAIDFDQMEFLYRTTYQPKASALAKAILAYVPHNNPRISIHSRVGDLRTFYSDDLTVMRESLQQGVAGTQLTLVANKLEQLVGYLPLPSS